MRVDGDGYHITGLKTTAHHEQDPAYLSWKVIRSANHKDIEAGFGGGLWTDYGNLGLWKPGLDLDAPVVATDYGNLGWIVKT